MTQSIKRIATIGVFDGVHSGHRWLLSQLKEKALQSGLTATAITFDRHPLALIAPDKAPKKLMPDAERKNALEAEGVDVIVLNFTQELRQLDARSFMKMLRDQYGVTTLLMGFNHRFGNDRISDFRRYNSIGQELGMEIIEADELPGKEHISSSAIRQTIAEGRVDDAANMMGHPYTLSGKVVSGHALGRSLGFPTANIAPDDSQQLLPLKGVYAVDITTPDGYQHRGALNIGYRPTVDHSAEPTLSIEAFIIGWKGDLYGKRLTVKFIKRLRGEKKFASTDELKVQLKSDCESALRIE